MLACDVPRVGGAVPRLVDAASTRAADASAQACDGVVLVDDDGRDQPLVGLYRRAALDDALARLDAASGSSVDGRGGVRGASVRALVDALDLVRLTDAEHHGVDVDTWSDVRALDGEGPATGDPRRGTMTGQIDARPDEMPEALPDAGGAA